ncbi:MAG TPA: glycosyltransferase family 39 protein [Micromonosporaceae bacterium]|jgi:4-amino-4-deoxy-L-arabinose transferase-like glycosyltransferase
MIEVAVPDEVDAPPTRPEAPAWVRPALAALLAGTAVLYLWDIGASGTANDFYAAAVQAGTKSWKAFFFGSFDSANFITVDKPPASLWVMELSGRIFGFNAWSMLVPQALEGVASVWLLYLTVRRWAGAIAGLVAGLLLAITPVAVLMFRFNNPDALLVLVCVAGAYAVVRAIEAAGVRWLVLAGALVGLGFLTKMLQALLVLPAFGLAYLICAPTTLRRRLLHLLAAGAAMVVAAGWWVAIVTVWPASSRPYIDNSTDNSVLNLAFGYNGFGRLTGNERGAFAGGGPGGALGGGFGGRGHAGGGSAGGSFGGSTGLSRLFGSDMGTQVSWLLPAALIALAAGLILTVRALRTDRQRALLILFGAWLVLAGLVFSYMQGIVHPYYTAQIAPAIAALVAIGGRLLWRRRASTAARITLAVMAATTAGWTFHLLGRDPGWHPWIRYATLAVGVIGAVGFVVPLRHALIVGGVAAALAGLLGTGAYAVVTAGTPEQGGMPTAGPPTASGREFAGPGGFRGGRDVGGRDVGGRDVDGRDVGGGGAGIRGAGGRDGSADAALVALLKAAGTKWSAATVGSQSAAPLELSSGTPIMSIGGFSGSDPAPTLTQFEAYVQAGDVHYYIPGGGFGRAGGGAITTWVESHYTPTTIGGETIYNLRRHRG